MTEIHSRSVEIPVAPGVALAGDLSLSAEPQGLVVFAHGSGSSRLSPRNRAVAGYLVEAGLGTLLFDLLTPQEAADRANVFAIPLLGERLGAAMGRIAEEPDCRGLEIGLFGASTGAAAALNAAAGYPDTVGAVVSRGGRPDLAGGALADVRAPVLLIVGGADGVVVDLNTAAYAALRCEKRLEIVPGATHLFEEPGALEAVMRLAAHWFTDHLGAGAAAPSDQPSSAPSS